MWLTNIVVAASATGIARESAVDHMQRLFTESDGCIVLLGTVALVL